MMEMITLSVAFGGSFFATEKEIKNIMLKPDGVEWELAINDDDVEPYYCKGRLVVTKFEKCNESGQERFLIEGTIDYNERPRKFRGFANPYIRKAPGHKGETTLDHQFDFVELPTPLTSTRRSHLVGDLM